MNIKVNKKYFWDYSIKNLDISNPDVLLWYIQRKIDCNDWKSIDKKALKKVFKKLKLDHYVKEILKDFLFAKK